MVQPGAPQQYPQHGQPAQQWQAHPQQPYAQPYPHQYPPPKKRGRAGGIVIGVLATLLVAGLVVGGLIYINSMDSDDEKPPADTSQDLSKAPLGCGLFSEDELRSYFPGPFETEPGGGLNRKDDKDEQAQCTWSNTHVKGRSQPNAAINVRTHLYKATRTGNGDAISSGVERATEGRKLRRGQPIGIDGTDDEQYVADGDPDKNGSARLYLRYRNVVVEISYRNQALGERSMTQPMLKLGTLAMSKIVPDDQDASAAPAIPGTGG